MAADLNPLEVLNDVDALLTEGRLADAVKELRRITPESYERMIEVDDLRLACVKGEAAEARRLHGVAKKRVR